MELRGGGIVTPWWEQQWEYGHTPEECTDFATVESDQYGDLSEWYACRAIDWRELRSAEREAEEEAEEEEEPESLEDAIDAEKGD